MSEILLRQILMYGSLCANQMVAPMNLKIKSPLPRRFNRMVTIVKR